MSLASLRIPFLPGNQPQQQQPTGVHRRSPPLWERHYSGHAVQPLSADDEQQHLGHRCRPISEHTCLSPPLDVVGSFGMTLRSAVYEDNVGTDSAVGTQIDGAIPHSFWVEKRRRGANFIA